MRNHSWPHAPAHWLFGFGHFMITAGTYKKKHIFKRAEDKDYLYNLLLDLIHEYDFSLKAWALFSNHYHVLIRVSQAEMIKSFIKRFHSISGKYINEKEKQKGRKVWYQYWDTHITYERSYLARIKYINRNPEHHGIVKRAEDYRWCSALWFFEKSHRSFYLTVENLKIDQVRVIDEF